ncbi:restriction endonuclease subunit S [Enterococcus sp. AZ102]|uniref:restriction endonuclease subunit S n=1 Tax=Enterococcus sp. AZ102 TaxID=2774865 RepID=UPI003F25E925
MSKPTIRFKGYTDDWEQRKLGEIVEIKDSARIPNTKWKNEGIPYLRSSDLSSGQIKGELFLSCNDYEEYEKKTGSPKKGDLLFNSGGDIGLAIYKHDELPVYVQGGSILYVKTSESKKLEGLFLQYAFESPKVKNYIKGASTGTSLKHFVLKPAKDLPVTYPNIEEQQKIGHFFKQLDDTIALHQRKLELLKEQKKGFLQKMFPKNEQSVPEIRFAGYTDDWEQRKLGEVADIVGGGTPSTSIDSYWNGDVDWYAPAEIGTQRYVTGSQKKITELGLKKSSARILPVGTVLFTSRAGIGNTAILAKEGSTNQGFQSIIPHETELDSYFIFSKTDELKQYGLKSGAGSTFVEVSGKQMAKMNLFIPDLKEQQKIGQFFKQLDDTIALHQRKLDKLKQIKQAFLQKMFV